MPHTYRYLVNPDGSPFDESKIEWPSYIGTWPPQTTGSILAIITGGSLIDDGVTAVQAIYPDAMVFDDYGAAGKAISEIITGNIVLQPIHLGKGEQGRARRAALERMAAEAGHFWGGKPSIGRWLVALANKELAHE